MKHRIIWWMAMAWFLSCSFSALPESAESEKKISPDAAAPVQPFLGRWDLTLKAPDRDYASWLEIRKEGENVKAQMVGRWGNARPLPRIEIKDNLIEFVSPKEEEERP